MPFGDVHAGEFLTYNILVVNTSNSRIGDGGAPAAGTTSTSTQTLEFSYATADGAIMAYADSERASSHYCTTIPLMLSPPSRLRVMISIIRIAGTNLIINNLLHFPLISYLN